MASDDAADHAIVRTLEGANVVVDRVATSEELVRRCRHGGLPPPELVLLDLELPDASAEQIVPIILGSFPSAFVVAIGSAVDGDRAARLLAIGVPSLNKPICPKVLTKVALQLSSRAVGWRAADRTKRQLQPTSAPRALDAALDAYSELRVVSRRQHSILRLYLNGKNDKEIALVLRCAESTVYEHWRRMARKVGGAHKGDVIADFHHFLGGR